LKLIFWFKNSNFQEKRPRLVTIGKVSSKLKKIGIIFMTEINNVQTSILKRRANHSSINCSYNFFQNITNPNKISTPLLNLLKKRNKPFIQVIYTTMTTRKKTLNFGDKFCRSIHGEKTILRIINILT